MRLFTSVVVISVALMTATANAQQAPQNPKTKLEAFTGSTGSIVIKGYTNVGTIKSRGNIEITAISLRNAQGGQEQKGVIIEVAELGRVGYARPSRSFLDYEEIRGLLEGIDYISKASGSVTEHPFYEAKYSTKGDFNIVVFNDGTEQRSVLVTSGSIGSQSAYLNMGELLQLRNLIIQARDTVDNPGAAKAAQAAKAKEKAEREIAERAARAAAEQAARELIQRPPSNRTPSSAASEGRPRAMPNPPASPQPLRLN